MEQLVSGIKLAAAWGIGFGLVSALTQRRRTKAAIDLLRNAKEFNAETNS